MKKVKCFLENVMIWVKMCNVLYVLAAVINIFGRYTYLSDCSPTIECPHPHLERYHHQEESNSRPLQDIRLFTLDTTIRQGTSH